MPSRQTLQPAAKDLGGGFKVRRLLPSAQRQAVGPFVFFDHWVVLAAGEQPVIGARGDARVMLIGGQPLGHRFINWNFVSSRKARIEPARDDWRAQRFDSVPGETEFIPLP
jgi:redox-sensitive bicupin YhaK (pirin superfamily)